MLHRHCFGRSGLHRRVGRRLGVCGRLCRRHRLRTVLVGGHRVRGRLVSGFGMRGFRGLRMRGRLLGLLGRLSGFATLHRCRLILVIVRFFYLLVFIVIVIIVAVIDIEGYVDLWHAQPDVVIVTAAHIVQVIISVGCVLGILVLVEVFDLRFRPALAARPLDGDLRRRSRRRIRLQEGAHLFRRGQLAINQLQEDGVQNLVVIGQLRTNPHLLHQGIRNALLAPPATPSGSCYSDP